MSAIHREREAPAGRTFITQNPRTADYRDAWYLVGPNQFVQTVHEPMGNLGPNDVRIQLLYNGHCESDVNVARLGRHPGQTNGEQRILLGHEPVGKVFRLGALVENLRLGDLVAIEPGLSCGQCGECRAGRYHTCQKVRYLATPAKAKTPQEEDWTNGSYVTSMDWPAEMCHRLPDGADPMVSALVESMAACRQAIGQMRKHTPGFDPNQDWVVILGAGQIACGLLLQLLKRHENLRVIVMARSEADRNFAESFAPDRVKTLPLPETTWIAVEAEQQAILAAAKQGQLPPDTAERFARIDQADESNAVVHQELLTAFREARRIAENNVACVFEATGQSHIASATLEARTVRGNGSYGFVSCLYRAHLDWAWPRRDEATVFTLRRSCGQFESTLRDLREHEGYYRRIIGRIVPFAEAPALYGKGPKPGQVVGEGPKTIIRY